MTKDATRMHTPKNKLGDEAVGRVLALLNHRPRREAARLAGVSVRSFYRIVKKYGGELLHSRCRRDPRLVELVRLHYPTMSGGEMEARFGIRGKRADAIARELGVRHTPETAARLRAKSSETLRANRRNVDHARAGRRLHALHRLEEMRVWEGRAQRTRLRVKSMPTRAYKARWGLVARFGYTVDADDPFTLHRRAGAHRSPYEARHTRKYGLRFVVDCAAAE